LAAIDAAIAASSAAAVQLLPLASNLSAFCQQTSEPNKRSHHVK
jgi:hypothetical protein